MDANTKPSFYYHADASALGGVLRQPQEKTVSTHGSVSLAQAGGFHTTKVDKFEMDGLISFGAAHVTVSGNEYKEDGGWRTVATASVERLNILDVVTADRIVAQISVMHFYGARPAEISFNGTQFVNLRVNGEFISPELEPDLFSRAQGEFVKGSAEPVQGKIPRFSDLVAVAERQHHDRGPLRDGFVQQLGSRFALPTPQDELEKKGSALCSLVKEVKAGTPAKCHGHVIHLPDFGNIFLGEMRVSPYSTQLTMARVEMGCVAKGQISVASTFSNGSTMP